VKNPTAKLDPKHEKTLKKFVKEFMDKAVQKKAMREGHKSAKSDDKAKDTPAVSTPAETGTPKTPALKTGSDSEMIGSDDDSRSQSSGGTKRKREADDDAGSPKRTRTETQPSPPPPPPPPPAADLPMDGEGIEFDSTDDAADLEEAAVPDAPNGSRMEGLKSEPFPSPMQLATPPTTTNGSCGHESDEKERFINGHQKLATPTAQVNGSI
jgi:histone-lysine N-methyltransferase SETD2